MQGLILCGQRWYSPAYGRWLSRDPAGYAGGADLYAYCGDNPIGAHLPFSFDPPSNQLWPKILWMTTSNQLLFLLFREDGTLYEPRNMGGSGVGLAALPRETTLPVRGASTR